MSFPHTDNSQYLGIISTTQYGYSKYNLLRYKIVVQLYLVVKTGSWIMYWIKPTGEQ